jgi:uncharacterized membrane protein (UPF0127 family)
MTAKGRYKKPDKSPQKNKAGFFRLILIIIAIIIAVAFLIFSVYQPGQRNKLTKPSSAIVKSSIVFRKDGALTLQPSGVTIDIEIVDEEPERIRGLMDRFTLPENAGMLFIFPQEELRSFWMKNTYISLDIIYINKNKEIVSIQKYTQPQTTSSIPSDKPAKFVLEVNAGFSDKYMLQTGDKIEFIATK